MLFKCSIRSTIAKKFMLFWYHKKMSRYSSCLHKNFPSTSTTSVVVETVLLFKLKKVARKLWTLKVCSKAFLIFRKFYLLLCCSWRISVIWDFVQNLIIIKREKKVCITTEVSKIFSFISFVKVSKRRRILQIVCYDINEKNVKTLVVMQTLI